ncbi:hypothetical protein JCM10207_001534 [Rhodosporidiobolus poonsookiae]
MSNSPSLYPPRTVPHRQQSRTPLLEHPLPTAQELALQEPDEASTPSSPLLQGRRDGRRLSSSSGNESPMSDNEEGAGGSDGLTPLDETLERVGMGKYQWTLLVLCGLGWAADNMWLQCVAVILPRVQKTFDIEDRWIGLLSTSIFAGMMVGAWGWGSYSDARGRLPAFNLTLCLTAIFGLASAFAPSFGWLCFALFLLGTGVGGSMPTDGTLFLENIPKTSHFLLTGLSVFFSLGAIFTSILGYTILPRFSCPPPTGDEPADCTDGDGWRYMLGALGGVSIAMFLARILFIRLQESPKFLVAANRPSAAVIALRRISKINGEEVRWVLSDVVDEVPTPTSPGRSGSSKERRPSDVGYASTGETTSPTRQPASPPSPADDVSDLDLESDADLSNISFGSARLRKERPAWIERLPRGWQDGAEEYLARVEELLQPEWKRTTVLVWAIWTLASAGYTIFNVFLPKFLDAKLSTAPDSSPDDTLRDYVLYTLSGLPGSLLGAYLVETSLGRAKTLAFSTLATSAGTFVFVFVSSPAGVVASSMAVSLAATLMYAVIYGLTPEVFPTSTRGTACGLASALSRLAGIIAPLFTGFLLSLSISLPLFMSGVCFFATAACAWGLVGVEGRTIGGGGGGGRVLAH